MKKTIALVTSIIFLAACGGGNKDGGSSTNEKDKSINLRLPFFETNLSITDPPIVDSFPDMYSYNILKPLVDSYISDPNIMPDQYFCFTFNSNLIQRYIDSCKSPIIQFFLAEDKSAAKPVYYMVAAMVDSNGANSYLNYKNKDGVLSHCAIRSCVPDKPAICDTNGTSNMVVKDYYPEVLSAAKAHLLMFTYQLTIQNMIVHQMMRRDASTSTNTWLYNANDLNSYITNAAAGKIKYIQVCLSSNRGAMDLILFGVDSSGKQMYVKYNKTSCVLENANPCPICELNNPLPSLSAPQSK